MSEIYYPCRTGLHVCGSSADGADAITISTYPLPSTRDAKATFDRARAELDAGDDGDMVVDLMCGGDIVEDFWIRRQMLDRLAAIVKGATG